MNGRVLIVLARSKSWYSGFITAITGTWFNHVFFVYEDGKFGGWLVLDILSDGPVILPPKLAMKRYKRIECWEWKGNMWAGIRESKDDIGSGYDWLGLFGAIFKLTLFKLFRIKRLNPVHWASRYMCFEWVMTVMKRAGVAGGENLNPAIVPPADFNSFVEKHEDFSCVVPPRGVWIE